MDDKVKEAAYHIYVSWIESGRDGDSMDQESLIGDLAADLGITVDDVAGLVAGDMKNAAREIVDDRRTEIEDRLLDALLDLQAYITENAQGE